MNVRPNLRNATLAAALAAIGATAWAAHDSGSAAYAPEPAVALQPADVERDTVAVKDTLAPNETVVVSDTAPAAEPAPVVERSIAQPGITVEQRRLSQDELIQQQVMERLASARNISGRVGVESQGSVVRLSGYTLTAGQAWRAGREAGAVTGVKYVQNEIRPRIGGSV